MSVSEQEREQPSSPHWKEQLSKWTSRGAVIFGASMALFFVGACISRYFKHAWGNMVAEHFPTIVGVPCAALAALCIVLTLDVVAGPIEFKVWVFEFRGAAGPVIMWVICFLTIVLAIHETWPQMRPVGREPSSQAQSESYTPPKSGSPPTPSKP